MIKQQKNGLAENSLLCERATQPDFLLLMAVPELYVNGAAGKRAQSANAHVDDVSAAMIKRHNSGLTDL